MNLQYPVKTIINVSRGEYIAIAVVGNSVLQVCESSYHEMNNSIDKLVINEITQSISNSNILPITSIDYSRNIIGDNTNGVTLNKEDDQTTSVVSINMRDFDLNDILKTNNITKEFTSYVSIPSCIYKLANDLGVSFKDALSEGLIKLIHDKINTKIN